MSNCVRGWMDPEGRNVSQSWAHRLSEVRAAEGADAKGRRSVSARAGLEYCRAKHTPTRTEGAEGDPTTPKSLDAGAYSPDSVWESRLIVSGLINGPEAELDSVGWWGGTASVHESLET